jgi:hypothetical protein
LFAIRIVADTDLVVVFTASLFIGHAALFLGLTQGLGVVDPIVVTKVVESDVTPGVLYASLLK